MSTRENIRLIARAPFTGYLCLATIPATHYSHCFFELSQLKPVYRLSFYFQVFTCTFILFRFTHVITTETLV